MRTCITECSKKAPDVVSLETDVSSQSSVELVPYYMDASITTLQNLACLSNQDQLIFDS